MLDTYPDQPLKGVVGSIGAGTGSEFALLPAQNATGNWVKVVQRVPLRVQLDPGQATAGAARRDERQRRGRHRPHPRPAEVRRRAARAGQRPGGGGAGGSGGLEMSAAASAAAGRPAAVANKGADHRLDHAGDDHAGARHHDRQRGAAEHAGHARRGAGPDHLGADLLHRRRRDHDAADRLALRPLSGCRELFIVSVAGFIARLDALRHGDEPGRDGGLPHRCRASAARRWCRCRRRCCSTSIRARSTARRWRSGAPASWSGRSSARRSAAG